MAARLARGLQQRPERGLKTYLARSLREQAVVKSLSAGQRSEWVVKEPVSITPRDFAASDMFAKTFAEGMGLVEETAAYLEGPGRAASRDLAREAALEYASESMRLTTKLMQVASWLLVHRAVREGEMTDEEAREERYRIREVENASHVAPLAVRGQLPSTLKDLRDRADKLFDRVCRLDARLHGDGAPAAPVNPVGSQLRALQEAFSRTGR